MALNIEYMIVAGGGGGGGNDWDKLLPGEALTPGNAIYSESGNYVLALQGDGNLVLYRVSPWGWVWQSRTMGITPSSLVMQYDGNLVLYDTSSVPHWYTSTSGTGTYMVVKTDGTFGVYSYDDTQQWTS